MTPVEASIASPAGSVGEIVYVVGVPVVTPVVAGDAAVMAVPWVAVNVLGV
jgi:hypothetical protein